jgi:hypothetical protein
MQVLPVATLEARIANKDTVALWWGLAESAFDGGLESGGRFCVGAFGRNLASEEVFTFNLLYKGKVSCPATHHGGAWGERRYSSYSFLTSALDGGEWSASRPSRGLPPGKGPPVPIVQEAGWAPEPVWTQGLEEKSSVGDRTPVV